MISVPLAPPAPMTAKSLAASDRGDNRHHARYSAPAIRRLDARPHRTTVLRVEGGKGYIVNVPETRQFAFVGSQWTNQTEAAAAPPISVELIQETWAFVVSGHFAG